MRGYPFQKIIKALFSGSNFQYYIRKFCLGIFKFYFVQRKKNKWNTDLPYAVIHRMAISGKYREKGLSTFAFNLIEDFCLSKNVENIRVDTDFQNRRMQHILEKIGFSKCGAVIFQGGKKLAYDKKLRKGTVR